MGEVENTMGDIKALEKQLDIKARQIAELMAEEERKGRQNFDEGEQVEKMRRAEFYLEKLIKSKTNEFQDLQKQQTELEAMAAETGFGDQIEELAAQCAEEEAKLEETQVEIDGVKIVINRHKFMADKYKSIMDQIESNQLDPANLVDTLQKESQALKDEIAAGKTGIESLKEAKVLIQEQMTELKTTVNSLDQARVDVVFRIFSLKGLIRNKSKFLADAAAAAKK